VQTTSTTTTDTEVNLKRGIAHGYRSGCPHCFGAWGTSCNAPNPAAPTHAFVGLDPATDSWVLADAERRNELTSRGFAFHARAWKNEYDQTVVKQVLPEMWKPALNFSPGIFAAQVPTSWPGMHCDKYPPISSAADGGDGTWQASLGPAFTVDQFADTSGDPPERIGIQLGYGFVQRSRACYMNGEQYVVVYSTTGNHPPTAGLGESPGEAPYADRFLAAITAGPTQVGDVHVIPIDTPSSVQRFYTATLNGVLWNPNTFDPNQMEQEYRDMENAGPPVYTTSGIPFQLPCNTIYHGEKYSGWTTYYAPDHTSVWQLARLKYQGQRAVPSDGNAMHDGIEAFVTKFPTGPDGDGALGQPSTIYNGNYVVAVFAQRCYKDRSLITETNPNEPYVAAIHKTFSTTKIMCSQWNSKVFRSGIGGADDGTGVADGTLSALEESAGEMIMDATAPPAGHSGETFPHAQIWHYNRAWDPIEEQNVNLLLLTTFSESTPTTISGVVSDFEIADGGSYDPHYLDHGLEAAKLHWNTAGEISGDEWLADNGSSHGITAHGGSGYAAFSNLSAIFNTSCDMWTVFTITTAGAVLTLWYIFDNRESAKRHFDNPTFTELTNFPIIENTFSVLLNNKPVACTIDGLPYDTSVIDNSFVPSGNTFADEAFYLTWKQISITIPDVNTYTLKCKVTRKVVDDLGHLFAYVDDVALPEVMLGSDINGYKRWDVRVPRTI
jgi:hypothetical protein